MHHEFSWRLAVVRASGIHPAALINLDLCGPSVCEDVVAALAGLPADHMTVELVRPAPGINPDRVRLTVDVPIRSPLPGRDEAARARAGAHAPRQTIDFAALRKLQECAADVLSMRGPAFPLEDLGAMLASCSPSCAKAFDVESCLGELDDLLDGRLLDGATVVGAAMTELEPASRWWAYCLASLLAAAMTSPEFAWPTDMPEKAPLWEAVAQHILGYVWGWDEACVVAGRFALPEPDSVEQELVDSLAPGGQPATEAPAGDEGAPQAASEPAGAPEGAGDEGATGAPGASGDPQWVETGKGDVVGVDLAKGSDATVTVERLAGDGLEQPEDGAVPSGETQDPQADA